MCIYVYLYIYIYIYIYICIHRDPLTEQKLVRRQFKSPMDYWMQFSQVFEKADEPLWDHMGLLSCSAPMRPYDTWGFWVLWVLPHGTIWASSIGYVVCCLPGSPLLSGPSGWALTKLPAPLCSLQVALWKFKSCSLQVALWKFKSPRVWTHSIMIIIKIVTIIMLIYIITIIMITIIMLI